MGGYAPNAQVAELERRIQQLDLDNRQLTTQLAQSQQKWQVADQRATLFQQQLQDTANQLQQARLAQQDLQGQTRGLQASINSRGGATLRPNTSGPANSLPGLIGSQPGPAAGFNPQGNGYSPQSPPGASPGYGQPNPGLGPNMGASNYGGSQLGSLASGAAALPSLANIQVPGAAVQVEGQAVRIRVPADQLFAPGSPQLNPNSYLVLDRVADAIFRSYPRQRVAVEGHTDAGNTPSSGPNSAYQLATAQAQAVMDQLVRRNSIPNRQLTVVAHGPNFPRGDNQSAAGRAANRRIEFVIYPEQF
jgi:chemotaxis protein MotB